MLCSSSGVENKQVPTYTRYEAAVLVSLTSTVKERDELEEGKKM